MMVLLHETGTFDAQGRTSFSIIWWTDYRPGHPDGEGPGWKGQCFFTNPQPYIEAWREAGTAFKELGPQHTQEEAVRIVTEAAQENEEMPTGGTRADREDLRRRDPLAAVMLDGIERELGER